MTSRPVVGPVDDGRYKLRVAMAVTWESSLRRRCAEGCPQARPGSGLVGEPPGPRCSAHPLALARAQVPPGAPQRPSSGWMVRLRSHTAAVAPPRRGAGLAALRAHPFDMHTAAHAAVGPSRVHSPEPRSNCERPRPCSGSPRAGRRELLLRSPLSSRCQAPQRGLLRRHSGLRAASREQLERKRRPWSPRPGYRCRSLSCRCGTTPYLSKGIAPRDAATGTTARYLGSMGASRGSVKAPWVLPPPRPPRSLSTDREALH